MERWNAANVTWPHLREDLWVEIVDPNGQPLPPGASGEIVITPITRRGMPLLRYKTGDDGLLLTEPCPCGALTPRLKVFGRISDRIATVDNKFLRVSDFEEPIFSFEFISDYDVKLNFGIKLEIIIYSIGIITQAMKKNIEDKIKSWLEDKTLGIEFIISIKDCQRGSSHQAIGGKRRLIKEND